MSGEFTVADAVGSIMQVVEQLKDIVECIEADTDNPYIMAKIPELTQKPVGDMIARDLLPQEIRARPVKLGYAISYWLDHLEVEVPALGNMIEGDN
jgi:hypothetical protein